MPSRRSTGFPASEPTLTAIDLAGRQLSNAAVMFHTAVASRLGLGPTEEKTLDLLERHGPLSPGDLGRSTGLAAASITGVLDRLERRGYVHRVRDSRDGRRVLVEIDREHAARVAQLFDDLSERMAVVYAAFTDAELAVVTRFLGAAAQAQHEATRQLSATEEPVVTRD